MSVLERPRKGFVDPARVRRRWTAASASAPSVPRLHLERTGSTHTLLDGGWWPRSTDPVAELPGLVFAIDKVRGPVTSLILNAEGWDEHPRRLDMGGRVLRLGFFASQPAALLTAFCDNGDRVDLLVVPPGTEADAADAAMIRAATTANVLHAEHILNAVCLRRAADGRAVELWESEGGSRLVTIGAGGN